MKKPIFCIAGESMALHHATNMLSHWGYEIVTVPSQAATHLLLPVPSLESDGSIKGGQQLQDILQQLQPTVTVMGGNLPSLPCSSIDFLQDEYYLQENAAITARCALVRLWQTCGALRNVRVMVIGWGRIGKQLASLLQESGAAVTVAARKGSARSAITASGYDAAEIGKWNIQQYDIIVNTAPASLLDQTAAKADTLLMDLASVRGIAGDRVIWARGLPNQDAPEESGALIAKTALRFALRKELL